MINIIYIGLCLCLETHNLQVLIWKLLTRKDSPDNTVISHSTIANSSTVFQNYATAWKIARDIILEK